MWRGEHYDRVADPQHRWGLNVLDRVPAKGIGRILDAGCGSGRVTEQLLERHPRAEVVAIDGSSSMLEVAAAKLAGHSPRCTLRQVDLEDSAAVRALGDFDAVVSTGTFHWIRDHGRLFTDLHAVLRPGGVLVSQSGGAGSVQAVRDVLLDLGVDWRPFNTYAGAEETERRLCAAGFEAVQCWMTDEVVALDTTAELTDYVHDGVLAPYVGDRSPAEQRRIAEEVVARLDEPRLRFVRLNIRARTRP